MPAFYSGRPNVGHMPLTPPGSGSGYRYSSMSYAHDNYTQPYQAPCSRQDSLYDYESGYLPNANANVNSLQAHPYTQPHFSSNTNLPPISAYYDAAGRSTLPPLRIDDRYSHSGSYHHRLPLDQQSRERQPRQAVKEEKATGGVSATLDYEMEQMTDFVTEAVQSIFQHTMQSAPSFRKWVLQVLSATRLPSATILLSLHYLSDRVTNHSRSIVTGDNQIYRLLAVALILGSKFLDDNTFINRSWSDVTAIKVTELNQLEFEWLELIDYTLHVDPAQRNGLSAWIEAWREYEVRDSIKQVSSRPPPLVTNFSRHQDAHDQRYTAYPSPYSQPSAQSFATPLSARSAHFTPLSYGSSNSWTPAARGVYEDVQKRDTRYPPYPEYDDLSRPAVDYHSRQMNYQFPPLSQSAIYQSTPSYSPWNQSWNTAHRYDCACPDCVYQNQCRPYHQGLGYSSVTAVA